MSVILVAGGRGRRFGGTMPKQFLPLGGEPMIVQTARRFVATPGLGAMIVVAAGDEHARCERLLAPLGLPLRFAVAGEERQHSVAAGVAALDDACDLVLVHDAVRPLVAAAQVAAVLAAADTHGAAILATPVADTVKRCDGERIVATVPRHDLWLAQTPQAFRADLLRRAHAAAAGTGEAATDDAALVERLGATVVVVAGDPRNRKITTRADLAWAESALATLG